jgi:endonuclease/exonuclease/phosphatase family metal-dependent hydrolase
MAARPRRTVRSKALRLAYWNADGVCGRKFELEHFLSQHGVDICLLNETSLNAGQAFRLANYACHIGGRPVKILAAYLSPSRPLIGDDLTACFGEGLPVLMAGDLNAKHVDWNSRLNTRRGKLLRDYADDNSCLIFGPDIPTTNPHNSSATPDVLDIAIVKDLPFPVFLTSCSALSSDHLPVLIDTA